MAKIKFSAVVGDARGIIGGNIFSRNKGGAYVKTFASPTNPGSTRQTAIRNRLASLSNGWRGLTDTQRASWIGASVNFPYVDSLGTTFYLSGQQLYIALNQNLLSMGEAIISTAPTSSEVLASGIASAVVSSSAFTLTFTEASMPSGQQVLVYASAPVSAGRNSFGKSDLKLIGAYDTITTNDLEIKSDYEARFGALSGFEGSKVGIAVTDVIEASGQTGTRKPALALIEIIAA